MRIQSAFPWANGANLGVVGLVTKLIEHKKELQYVNDDRDKYGRTLSGIRALCAKALYGVDGANLPTSIKDVVSTTELVQGVIKIARDEVEIIRRRRIADSERMGAEMSARRSFVCSPVEDLSGPVRRLAASIGDEQLRNDRGGAYQLGCRRRGEAVPARHNAAVVAGVISDRSLGRVEPIDGPFRFALVPHEDIGDATRRPLGWRRNSRPPTIWTSWCCRQEPASSACRSPKRQDARLPSSRSASARCRGPPSDADRRLIFGAAEAGARGVDARHRDTRQGYSSGAGRLGARDLPLRRRPAQAWAQHRRGSRSGIPDGQERQRAGEAAHATRDLRDASGEL